MSPSRTLLVFLWLGLFPGGPMRAMAAPPEPVGEHAATPSVAPAEAAGQVPATEVVPREPDPIHPAGPVPSTPAEREAWLKARLDEILGLPSLGSAKFSVAVAEVDTGRMLYGRNDGALLNPASNVKLVTTAAALAQLGPEYRFKTVLLAEAPHGGVIEGSLYLRGYGDPSLVGEDLWKMASDLAARGVKKVAGDLVVDDTFFDAERVGPGFEQKQEDAPFRAPSGAVSLNYNACAILVLPGKKAGDPVRVLVDPASPYFTVASEATTVASGRAGLQIEAREAEGHTVIHVSGSMRVGDGGHSERRRIAHPDLYAGYTLRELLARRGIAVAGQVVTGQAPTSTRTLATHYSQPLGVLVRDVNKSSNNFMAEQVLKTLGAELGGKPGTWAKGVDGVGRFLETLGVGKSAYKMTNGSGLYDSNRFSAAQLVAILRSAYRDFRFAADFVGSLALAGADGTIGHRMAGGLAERYVRAKTGTLSGVSCLSGYAGAPGRLPLAFSILMNDLGEGGAHEARRAQDAIAETLVQYLMAR
jgi:D-alanyl-D-alanine carboxypeptidase/D-alanyl-D-alanine-endopeptidase (penicillin-binding protein 4)